MPLRCRGEAVSAGSPVQIRDQVAGWGEHDRVQSFVVVGPPRLEQVLGECGQVADVDALAVRVAQRLQPAVLQRHGGGRFGGIVLDRSAWLDQVCGRARPCLRVDFDTADTKTLRTFCQWG
jgi:hypothetical protein